MKPTAAPSSKSNTSLQVIGDKGTPVDWWFIYKISKESQSESTPPAKQGPTGQEYLYYDSAMAKGGAKPVLSSNLIDKRGALFDTYSQLFTPAAKANKDLGYYCYNDEDRIEPASANKPGGGGTGPSPCGHCKGAVAFDLASDSSFWLIHSVPLKVKNAAFVYPATGLKMGQTMLCIQLPNADASKSISQLILDAHGPNVHVASDLLTNAHDPANNFKNAPVSRVPASLRAKDASDPRLALMANDIPNNKNGTKIKPYSGQVPFTSKGGQAFLAIAKNRAWGDPACGQPVKDFYDVLVSTALNENIEVETWEDCGSKIPPAQEAGETHDVENMHAVNLTPLGIPWSWDEQSDHAKLAISDRNNSSGTDRWVCVGDINYTDSMEKRGGGTCAFICDPLWQALSSALSAAEKSGSKVAAASPASSAKKTLVKPTGSSPTSTKVPAARNAVPSAGSSVKPSLSRKVASVTKAINTKAPIKKAVVKKALKTKVPSKKAAVKKAAPKKKTAVKKAPAKKAASNRPAAKVVKKKGVKKTGKNR